MSKETKVYSDEEILNYIELMHTLGRSLSHTMLQQLMDERDAVLKDLKALEAEVGHVNTGVEMAEIDLFRSEKYDEADSADMSGV